MCSKCHSRHKYLFSSFIINDKKFDRKTIIICELNSTPRTTERNFIQNNLDPDPVQFRYDLLP